ncbi:LamG-like jellyroll fold domain-containing protein [Sphingobacterium deserti]|uniref:Type I phosphodiesterase/nucleotide pyrophosphatase n=1 Tax=Sphingobacterium deserti TaxID=1229276 RepID=A0A0B8TA65_9SPHI|nr:DUF4983 domain-containing protein [Sphingobacterium deserti]KGE15669.1 type I phosphodiesterase/nucleotide pyrophosphatase [Sphingobacterium deserti]
MNTITSKPKRWRTAFWKASLGVFAFLSCNEEFPNRLSFDQEYQDPGVQETQYKVAYVVLEGGVGTIVAGQATDYGMMPTLGDLYLRSVTSWNSVSTANKDELTAYADLLTGVEYPKHQVVSQGDPVNLENFPTLFSRVKQQSNARTAFITANRTLAPLVSETDLDQYQVLTDDQQVTANAVDELARDDVAVVVATYKEVDDIGLSQGYTSEAYLQALNRFDGQLNELVSTIRARENYISERWLIVVASSTGGRYTLRPELDDGSIFAETERNNFVVIHNPQFVFRLVERLQTNDPAWMSSAVRYTGNQGKATIAAENASIYNIEKNKEYTIQMKVKVHSYGNADQTIFSKRSNTAGSQEGWAFMLVPDPNEGTIDGKPSRGLVRFKVAGVGDAEAIADVELETWYSFIVRVYIQGGKQYATIFRDGVEYKTSEITGAQGVSNDPLQLGYAPGYAQALPSQSHSIADIRIYNVAQTVDHVKQAYCSTMATPGSDPYYDNLIGYWPGDDNGTELRDRTANNRHFVLEGNYAWNDFSERAATLCPTLPDNPEHFVLRTVDVPRMIYSWMNFKGIEQFNLDGQIWNPNFVSNQ